MKKLIIISLALSLLSSPAIAIEAYELSYELRIPKSTEQKTPSFFHVVSDIRAASKKGSSTERAEDGSYIKYSAVTLIFIGAKRRALIIEKQNNLYSVFRLSIPSHPNPIDWTNWKGPDYTETTDAIWTFMHNIEKNDRSISIPQNSFELRYKITKWKKYK